MTPLSALRAEVERLSAAEFCAAHPHPYFVVSVAAAPLSPVDGTQGLTIDRVVVPADGAKLTQPAGLDDFLAAPIKSQQSSSAKDITIGCSSHCDVRINDTSVSKLHAYLLERTDGWHVEDASSLTGTRVNDLQPGSAALESGDRVTIGLVDLVFLQAGELYQLVHQLARAGVSKQTPGLK